MKKIIFYGFAISSLLINVGCETDFETDVDSVQVNSGSADFSKYVALGNSLTSGYRDGTLYIDGQNESYPSMIAQQMMLAGGGAFKQPMMPNNIGGFANVPGFGGKYSLQVVNGSLTPVAAAPAADLDFINSGAPYQNLGAPGAKSFHLLFNGYGNPSNLSAGMANPFYVRFASAPNASILEDAMAQNPTFFSLWIGNMDVLGYATSGGGDSSNPITDEATFTGAYTALVNTLTSGGAKGVVANIPNVTSIPYFTTIPYNPVPLTDAQVSAINPLIAGLKQILTAYGDGDRLQTLGTSNNPLLIKDESLTNRQAQITQALALSGNYTPTEAYVIGLVFGQARHTTSADLIPLTTRAVIGTAPSSPYAVAPLNAYGVSFPLEDRHILRGAFAGVSSTATEPNEIKAILDATATFNSKIKELATAKNLAFVDANKKMDELATNSGLVFNGVNYSATFVTGGTFSLDGIHPTGRGYAVIANEFIKAINNKYGSNLPQVDASSYSGVQFP